MAPHLVPHLGELDWPVRTERLSLRPARESDAAAVVAYRRLEPVSRWLTTLHDTEEAWAEHLRGRADKTLVIERDGVVVGDLYLAIEDGWAQGEVQEQAVGTVAEVGYVLDPAVAGKGYATEAVEALLRVVFDGLGVRRVVAHCFADNDASWRLMERVGMRREAHTVRDSLHRSEGWLDGLSYALLADEWRGRRGSGSPAD